MPACTRLQLRYGTQTETSKVHWVLIHECRHKDVMPQSLRAELGRNVTGSAANGFVDIAAAPRMQMWELSSSRVWAVSSDGAIDGEEVSGATLQMR